MAAPAAERLGQLVAQAVQQRFASLPKSGKNQPHEQTVLAGIVAYLNDDEEEQPALSSTSDTSAAPAMHVVAIGTGTKCLGASKRSAACDVINDSHAEVITRRAFVAWVYQQLQLAVELHKQTQQDAGPSQLQAEPRHKQQRQQQQQQQGTALAPSCRPAFVWCLDTRKFRLNSGVKFAMYVSQPPCGDASIYSSEQPAPSQQQQHQEQQQQQPAAAGRTGAKLIRLSGTADVGQAAAAIAGTAGEVAAEDPTSQPPHNSQQQQQQQQPQQQQGVLCVPCASDVEAGPQQLGVLRRKPGKGDPTLSLSCSDKLARWACLGLQGCLLSSCLDAPLYLDLLVVSVPPSSTAAATAAPASTAVGAGADEKQNQQHDEARLREVEAAGMRAFGSRLQGCSELLQPPFAVHAPVVVAVQAADSKLGLYPDDARRSPSGVSINWSCQLPLLSALTAPPAKPSAATAAGVHEVTLAAHGRKAGAGRKAPNWSNKKTRSRLCSAVLYEQWQALLAMLPALMPALLEAGVVHNSAGGCSRPQHAALADEQHQLNDQQLTDPGSEELNVQQYRAEKQRKGQSYQQAWSILRNCNDSIFAGWLAKPQGLTH